jgi:FtsP/CotA-like multicopper oxidase with cupredoxin domain
MNAIRLDRMPAVVLGVLLLAVTPAAAEIFLQCPNDFNNDGLPDSGDHRCVTLSSSDGFTTMADGRVLYVFGFSDMTGTSADLLMEQGMLRAEFAAPTIVVDEGEEFYLNLFNAGMVNRPDLSDPHSVHWHGFPNASAIFDGVPDSSLVINMGSNFTYYYKVPGPGTYMYHCHVEATEHMQMGMLGNLYVRPRQNRLPDGTLLGSHVHDNPDEGPGDDPLVGDRYVYNDGDGSTRYDVEKEIQMGSFDGDFHDASESVQPLPFALMKDKYPMLNGRGYPDTINTGTLGVPDHELAVHDSQKVNALVVAEQGDQVVLRISDLNITRFYTLASMGIPMRVVGRDARHLASEPLNENLYYTTHSLIVGGGEAFDVILDTTDVEPGTYFLYTTNLNYLSNNEEDFGGMMTEIVVQ